jgi:hypothetical protein
MSSKIPEAVLAVVFTGLAKGGNKRAKEKRKKKEGIFFHHALNPT